MRLRFDDGLQLDLACVRPEQFALALWRATGSASHVKAMTERAASLGLTLAGDELRGNDGALVPVLHERDLYAHCRMSYIEPEMREAFGEIERAARAPIGPLVTEADLAGALHCHSQYSDGGATIADMAAAAQARGLRYLGGLRPLAVEHVCRRSHATRSCATRRDRRDQRLAVLARPSSSVCLRASRPTSCPVDAWTTMHHSRPLDS